MAEHRKSVLDRKYKWSPPSTVTRRRYLQEVGRTRKGTDNPVGPSGHTAKTRSKVWREVLVGRDPNSPYGKNDGEHIAV